MPKLINIKSFKDKRGSLSFIEKQINFPIKRIYYIHNISGERGGHKHKKTTQFFICLHGKVEIAIQRNKTKKICTFNSAKRSFIISKIGILSNH